MDFDKKNKTGFRQKNAQLRVEEKKEKKEMAAENTALPPTRRKSPRTKLEAAGMRQCNRSKKAKKSIRSSSKQKERI